MGKPGWGGLAVAACLLLLAPGAGASNNSLYTDAASDAPAAAPDLTSAEVSSDDAGRIVFRISIPNRAALEGSDLISLFVDTDGRIGTGCARGTFGAEYSLAALGRRYVFGRCVRGRWSFRTQPRSFKASFASSTLTLRTNLRALGDTRALTFRIGAAALRGEAAYDFAPDIGTAAWSYRVAGQIR
jgi:hypothetical protein